MKYGKDNLPLVCMQTQSTCYKGTTRMEVKGVLWHSTGANNPNIKRYVQPSDDAPDRDEMLKILGVNSNKNDWNHVKRNAGLNCWIGKIADGTVTTIQTMPWDFKPWGCGTAYKKGPSCNNGWIQFEICEDDLKNKDYFEKVYEEACEITAYLCVMYDIDPKGTVEVNGKKIPTILCHADSYKLGMGSNHGDVNHWFPKFGKTMEDVKNDVAKLIANNDVSIPTPVPTPTPAPETKPEKEEIYRVRKTWKDSKSQVGAYKVLANAKQACDKAGKEYHVYDSQGKEVYPNKEIDTSKVDISPADPKIVWDFLKAKGLNDYGAAGLMGNLYAESGIRPTNLQNGYEKTLGLTDAEYTAAIDQGIYTNFVNDKAGYGLAQWTFWSRKQAMLDFHKAAGKSIGDLNTQLNFLVKELTENYEKTWEILKTAKNVKEASNAVLLQYERPADQGEEVQAKRAEYGQVYYDKYAVKEIKPETPVKKNLYRVRKSWKDAESQIGAYADLNNAKKACDEAGIEYKVFDEAGEQVYPEISKFPYRVIITASKLNVRAGAGTSYKINTQVEKDEVFTIVDEKGSWGKLKSDKGWIHLGYTKPV